MYYRTVKIHFSPKLADCAAVLRWGKSGLPHQNFLSTGKTLPSLSAVSSSSVHAGTQPGSVAHQSQKHALLRSSPLRGKSYRLRSIQTATDSVKQAAAIFYLEDTQNL